MKQISKFQLKELFKKKWLKRLDRYIIVKFWERTFSPLL